MPAKPSPFLPVVRVAPFGPLDAYPVYEYELDLLASGAPGSQLLGIAYALIGFAGALVIAIFGTDIPSDRVYSVFVLAALVTGLVGGICLVLGQKGFQTNHVLVAEIKRRMPPPPAEPMPPPAPTP